MQLVPTRIPDVLMIEPRVIGDERGFFLETWNRRAFAALGLDVDFVQDNHSKSLQGILRGLHYQTEHVQGKLVRVTAGEVFDVAVDLRRDSPTYRQWAGVTLSAANFRMLWIPPGFAHGFYVCSAFAEFVYKCTDYYSPQHEVSIRWDDPDLAIEWPLIEGRPPALSVKDAAGIRLVDAPAPCI
jgi:dTDP-4-dehydrorhamnose 3,5-epimerase